MKSKINVKTVSRVSRIAVMVTVAGAMALSIAPASESSNKAQSRVTGSGKEIGGPPTEAESAEKLPITPIRSRVFDFVYTATVRPTETRAKASVDIFVPIARDTARQEIVSREIQAPINGTIQEEEVYENRFWYAHLPKLPDEGWTITVRYRVKRIAHLTQELWAETDGNSRESELDRKRFEVFLKPNKHVPIEGPMIRKRLRQLGLIHREPKLAMARRIYDHVIGTMEYKKVGTGWGHGDTYWACTEGYGNCTDFHALFTSLARNRGMPVQFKMGFPVPIDRSGGEIGGYHCWLNFALPGKGWVPIDASEAKKHPELQDFLFGNQLPDRIEITRGRDLELGPEHDAGPLNYFVHPHVEIDDEAYNDVAASVSFSEVTRRPAN